MELVAKKISKTNTGNSEKLSNGSFFKPAPALAPQTSRNNKPPFFKPPVQTFKTVDAVSQTKAPVTTNKINGEPTPAVINKSTEVNLVAGQPVLENDVQQTNEKAANNSEQVANNGNVNAKENNVAGVPVNKNRGIQDDEKSGLGQETKDAATETKPGLRFINPAATEKVFQGKITKAGKLAKTTATTKTAKAKITESEQAQDKPEAEQHSDSNHGQVTGYAGQSVAEKSKAESENVLKNAIEQVIPKTIGDISSFKSNGKGKHISNAVSTQVKGDVGSVKSSFGGMGKTPAPAAAEKGKELPLPEEAGQVDQLNMGAGVVPQIEAQHLDTTDYLKQNDDLLKKEELPQEHLEMVDSGDLAEANKQRTQLKADAVEQPTEIKEAAANEHKQLNANMHAEEKQGRQQMTKHREGKLKDTGENQKTTKTKLEKEREDVAKLINGKYEACQKSIISKLDALENDSLAKFDQGQVKATADFETQVNNDIEEFKRKRYDVNFIKRGVLKAKDWLMGIDDFPEVSKAFNDARTTFEQTIDRLIGEITADNNKVIAECKAQLQTTKDEIAKEVAKLKPALQSAGEAAMKEVEKKLDELNAEIDKRKEKMQQQLADKRQAAMKAIDARIEKMKEKLSGALSAIGKLLLEALKKFFKWALEKLGIDAEGFFNTLSKIGTAIKAMFKSPGKFFSNLIASVKGAISDFKANFKTYLTGALFDWLTGSIGSVVTLPKVFDVRGVIGIIMQVAGISWAYIRGKLVDAFGEQKVALAEKTVDVVKKFVNEGIMGIWDWIKNSAQSLMTTMIDSIKEWLLTKMVISFVEWVASLLIPGGAILRLVQGIYKLVMWFVNNIQRILRWVNSVLDSMVSIASGAIGAAVGFIVGGMKLIIPAILDFFAKLLNIGGIVDAVKNIIKKVAEPIHIAIDKFIAFLKGILNKVVDKVKGAFGKKEEKPAVAKKEEVKSEHDTEVGKVVHFSADGENHEIWIEVVNGKVEIMVASHNPSPVTRRLTEWKKRAEKSSKVNEQAAISKIGEAQAKYDLLMSEAKSVQEKMMAGKTNKDEKKLKEGELLDNKVESDEEILSRIMAELFVVFGKTDEFDAAVIAEAQGKFQGITDKANSNVGSRISKLTQFNLLSNEEVVAARKLLVEEGKGPWLYYANYGKAIERLADNYVMGSPEFQSITKNANNPDFEGKKGSKYEGLVFDITTSNPSTIDAHVRRTKDPKKSANYKNVIITPYERVITVQSELINKMDANIE